MTQRIPIGGGYSLSPEAYAQLMLRAAQGIKARQLEQARAAIFADPIAFAADNLYILDKRKQQIRLRYNTIQLDYLANRTRRDLILKPRQVGFSTFIQADGYRRVNMGNFFMKTLCHDDKLTAEFRLMMEFFHSHMPDNLRPVRKYANAYLTSYPELNSQVTISTVGGQAGEGAGRGGTQSFIHGSEVAYWSDAEAVTAGALQAGDPEAVLESTPNGAQGHFFTLCMEALDGNTDWRLHFYEWWKEPTYCIPLDEGEVITLTDDEGVLVEKHNLTPQQIKWRRVKQREVKALFLQEYPEDPRTCFLLSGTGYFGDIAHCFKAPIGATYDPSHQYYAGLDFGQTVDYTVCFVIDKTANVQVDLLRINREQWGEMRRQVRVMCQKWHVKTLQAEKNSMGTTNTEELRKEFTANHCDTHIVEFDTTNASKAGIASDFHEALHELGFQMLPILEQRREFMAFQSRQTPTGLWQLSAANGEHDDCVMAGMLAWRASVQRTLVMMDDAPDLLADWRG